MITQFVKEFRREKREWKRKAWKRDHGVMSKEGELRRKLERNGRKL